MGSSVPVPVISPHLIDSWISTGVCGFPDADTYYNSVAATWEQLLEDMVDVLPVVLDNEYLAWCAVEGHIPGARVEQEYAQLLAGNHPWPGDMWSYLEYDRRLGELSEALGQEQALAAMGEAADILTDVALSGLGAVRVTVVANGVVAPSVAEHHLGVVGEGMWTQSFAETVCAAVALAAALCGSGSLVVRHTKDLRVEVRGWVVSSGQVHQLDAEALAGAYSVDAVTGEPLSVPTEIIYMGPQDR